MPDLADRISRAAVAALDLAPFDDRYGRLSRQVLAGGASRFGRVIADGQAVHFVIPVGLAGEQIQYGALVLQDRQAGVLWRDAQGIDHGQVVPRSAATRTTHVPVILGGQEWVRFDVDTDGDHLAFLAPPVSGSLLRTTLVDFFSSSPAAVLPAAAAPAPAAAVAEDDRSPDASSEATAIQDAAAADEPDGESEDVAEPAASVDTGDDLEATQLMSPWSPSGEASAVPSAATAVPAEEATRVPEPPFDLYRDARTAPQAAPAATAVWPTTDLTPASPTPVAPAQEAAPVEMHYSSTSRTTIGFLIGLLATLAIGGVVIISQLLGA